jgi:hypothetical protein
VVLSPAQKAAAWAAFVAVSCLAYGGYAVSVVLDLHSRYGADDRILIQIGHAVAGCGLGVVIAAWAVHLLRGGQQPTEQIWRARPGEWSGWMLTVGFAFLVAFLALGYEGARSAADIYRASDGRGVHGTLTVQSCTAQEHGFKCEGTFRADDGSFEVERVTAYPDHRPEEALDGWVSGPRPLGMFDGTPGAWRDSLVPLGVFAVMWLTLLGFLSLVAVRKALARQRRGAVSGPAG